MSLEYLKELESMSTNKLVNVFSHLSLYKIVNIRRSTEKLDEICDDNSLWEKLTRLKYPNMVNQIYDDEDCMYYMQDQPYRKFP